MKYLVKMQYYTTEAEKIAETATQVKMLMPSLTFPDGQIVAAFEKWMPKENVEEITPLSNQP